MRAFVCEKCGADLRLSLPDHAYLCNDNPREHRFDRGECEEAWIKQAAGVVEQDAENVDAVFQLASLLGRLASTSIRAGDPDPARAYMSQLVGVTALLYEAKKHEEQVRAMYMEALIEQATVGEKLRDPGMAAGAYERLLPLVQGQADSSPKNVEYQRNLSVCLNGAGRMLRSLGNDVGAKKYFERDLGVLELLQELYPDNHEIAFDRAVARFNLFLVCDVRAEETEQLHAVLSVLDELPPDALPERAPELRKRTEAELERIASTDDEAPERLAQAAADAARAKVDDEAESPDQDRRQWLIEQVDQALRGRRKRLPVVR